MKPVDASVLRCCGLRYPTPPCPEPVTWVPESYAGLGWRGEAYCDYHKPEVRDA